MLFFFFKTQGQKENKAQGDSQVPRGQMDPEVSRGQPVKRDNRVNQVHKDNVGLLVTLGNQVIKDPGEGQAPLDHLGTKENQAAPGNQGDRGLLAKSVSYICN